MLHPQYFDFIIIGSGMGGSTMAYGLKDTGASILILERGDFLPAEPQNWDVNYIACYRANETWFNAQGQPLQPRIYYNVGGNTKVYGAAMLRYREQDFTGVEHEEGYTVPWPITYGDLRPYYDWAEQLLGVCGQAGKDPTEPPRNDFPAPPMPHEPIIKALAESFQAQGLRPFHLPVAIDFGPDGSCVRCQTCDGFPCKVQAKGDAETRILSSVLAADNVTLWTKAKVERLTTGSDGKRVERVIVTHSGQQKSIQGGQIVLAAGAINSAVLLLKSKSDKHPHGLANSSGLVGRNYMAHNNTVVMAVSPWRKNPSKVQKTLAINDFYAAGPHTNKPLGNIQMRGKILSEMLENKPNRIVRTFRNFLAPRSLDLWIMSEDLASPDNRVMVDEQGRISLHWQPTNAKPHQRLVEIVKRLMRKTGYPLIFTERRGLETISHQCGTLRFGNDPKTAVLDKWCRSFDVPNLFVVDTSFYPSSAAVNPALTLVAQALRVSEYIARGT